ncbi:hypothetical protein [Lishizhenia sp.]|uniref:hypothetical protein n=1 Tax=Lishizhenia sp. TaxID=2497594 RepID=UPI00299DF78D|nr:hypothetical protein [Lishizhenia sp.]
MKNVTDKQKWVIRSKMLEFQKNGLLSYGKYLDEQLKFASKSQLRVAYKSYIEKEITRNNDKIRILNERLM